ncbi:hypothetical protein H8959_009711 [Pygathrix nigripes]
MSISNKPVCPPLAGTPRVPIEECWDVKLWAPLITSSGVRWGGADVACVPGFLPQEDSAELPPQSLQVGTCP